MTRKDAFGVSACIAVVSVATVLSAVHMGTSEGLAEEEGPGMPGIPIDGPYAYRVQYLGVTCGHMTLESRLDAVDGRKAYHIIMTARNSKFFNKIYKVEGRIESWIDAETLTSVRYDSTISEKGKLKVKRYRIDAHTGVVTSESKGKVKEIPYDGEPALDPMGFVYRSRVLARDPGSSFSLRLLTDYGPIATVSQVGELKRFDTFEGKKALLRVQPMTADGEMFSRKGEFVIWIDPREPRTLHRLDFKLGFGRLVAVLTGPVER